MNMYYGLFKKNADRLRIWTYSRDQINRRFGVYILVGILNTIFGYSAFALFIFLQLHYALAVFLATLLGIMFNFKTIGTLVFKNNNNKLFAKFIGVYVVTYFLNVLSLSLFNKFNFNLYLAGLILIIPMAFVSFILNNAFVFKKEGAANAVN